MGYGGRSISKRITVKTNDPGKPLHYLTVKGHVDTFVKLIPKRIYLRGSAGTEMKTTVKIIPQKKYPFKIVETKALNKKYIQYKLKEMQRSNKPEYELTVENLKKNKGRYFDMILLKTDSKIRPEIKIPVTGFIIDRKKQNNSK